MEKERMDEEENQDIENNNSNENEEENEEVITDSNFKTLPAWKLSFQLYTNLSNINIRNKLKERKITDDAWNHYIRNWDKIVDNALEVSSMIANAIHIKNWHGVNIFSNAFDMIFYIESSAQIFYETGNLNDDEISQIVHYCHELKVNVKNLKKRRTKQIKNNKYGDENFKENNKNNQKKTKKNYFHRDRDGWP